MSSKNGYYSVGCRLPHGLVIQGAGKKVRLNGKNSARIDHPAAYGLTEQVPADVWEDYVKVYAQSNVLKNGMVFAASDKRGVEDAAKEVEKEKTGLEQVDPTATSTKPDSEA